MIGVVIPTIDGREDLLDETIAAYRATADCRIVVVRNRPTIGEGWNDGAAALIDDPEIEYLHLSADDVIPHDAWDDAAIKAANDSAWPSPRITNRDGSLHSCGSLGGGMLLPECADWTICSTSPFPFMRAEHWKDIGPALPIHYYADDHLAWSARERGFEVVVRRDYRFTHLEGTTGRSKVVARAMDDLRRFLTAVGNESREEAAA